MSTQFCAFYGDYMKKKYIYPRIKELRIGNNLTQEELSKMLNLYTTQYRRYETGETEIPVHIIKELCSIYNVTSDYIIGTDDTKE